MLSGVCAPVTEDPMTGDSGRCAPPAPYPSVTCVYCEHIFQQLEKGLNWVRFVKMPPRILAHLSRFYSHLLSIRKTAPLTEP